MYIHTPIISSIVRQVRTCPDKEEEEAEVKKKKHKDK